MFPSSMSEFKYACPVCGQHIKCDSSQAGTQMECPTCFQKITVPQAPTGEGQKFILTGVKKTERPIPTAPAENGPVISRKNSPLAAVAVVIVLLGLLAAGALAYKFRDKIFKTAAPPADQAAADETTNKVPEAPALVAPHANDTNWMLNLTAVEIPDGAAAGRIHGQDFITERAILQSGTLTLRAGRTGPLPLGFQVNFGGVQPEALANQTLNIATNAPMAARVILSWTDGDHAAKEIFQGGYAMRLNFGEVSGNHISGKIYFCAPDDLKSYVMGTFNAEIRKPKLKKQ
jgi:DNA-directed RNA polymerase subunit RPC12/RpoP